MTNRTGEQARNEEFRENDSLEQEEKIRKGEDIEPQAEKWSDKPRDREDGED